MTLVKMYRGDACRENISILNPLVEVFYDHEEVHKKKESYFLQFNIICASKCSMKILEWLDEICRAHKIYFFATDTFGVLGYFFIDLTVYKYTKKAAASEGSTSELEEVTLGFSSLRNAFSTDKFTTPIKRLSPVFFILRALYSYQEKYGNLPNRETSDEFKKFSWEKFKQLGIDPSSRIVDDNLLSEIALNSTSQIPPVCAILGGILSQEILKVIFGKEEPLNNFFFYSGFNVNSPGNVAKIP